MQNYLANRFLPLVEVHPSLQRGRAAALNPRRVVPALLGELSKQHAVYLIVSGSKRIKMTAHNAH